MSWTSSLAPTPGITPGLTKSLNWPNSVPSGSDPTSGTPYGHDHAKGWAPFFGVLEKQFDHDPRESSERTMRLYHEAFRGKSQFLEEVSITYISYQQQATFREWLPWTDMKNAIEVEWSFSEYTDYVFDDAPPLAVPRVVSSTTARGKATLGRKNLGMMMSFEFYQTLRGQMTYKYSLLQIVNAEVHTINAGVFFALLNPPWHNLPPQFRVDQPRTEGDLSIGINMRLDSWGAIHKERNAVANYVDAANTEMRKRIGRPITALVMPSGTTKFYNTHSALRGRIFNGVINPPINKVGQEDPVRVADGELQIYESFPTVLGVNMPRVDLLLSPRQVCTFSASEVRNLTDCKDGTYRTGYMDISIYNEPGNEWAHIKYREGLMRTGLFHNRDSAARENSGATDDGGRPMVRAGDLTKEGEQFFRSYSTFGDYMEDTDNLRDWVTVFIGKCKGTSPLSDIGDLGSDEKLKDTKLYKEFMKRWAGGGTEIDAGVVSLRERIKIVYEKAGGDSAGLNPSFGRTVVGGRASTMTRPSHIVPKRTADEYKSAAAPVPRPPVPDIPEYRALYDNKREYANDLAAVWKLRPDMKADTFSNLCKYVIKLGAALRKYRADDGVSNIIISVVISKFATSELTKQQAVESHLAAAFESGDAAVDGAVKEAILMAIPEVYEMHASAAEGDSAEEEITSVLKDRVVISGHFVKWCLDNDMWPLLSVGYLRFPVWLMGTAIAFIRGGYTGHTFHARHNWMVSVDTSQQVIYAHASFWFQAVVLKAQSVLHWDNCLCVRPISGNGVDFYDANEESDVVEFQTNASTKSIIAIPLDPNEPLATNPYFSITGRWHPGMAAAAGVRGEQPLHYRFARQASRKWKFQQPDQLPYIQAKFDDAPCGPTTTLSFREGFWAYGGSKSGPNICGIPHLNRFYSSTGHWKNVYVGVDATRRGAVDYIEKISYENGRVVNIQSLN